MKNNTKLNEKAHMEFKANEHVLCLKNLLEIHIRVLNTYILSEGCVYYKCPKYKNKHGKRIYKESETRKFVPKAIENEKKVYDQHENMTSQNHEIKSTSSTTIAHNIL